MKSVRDKGRYPRVHDPDLRSPLMQAGLVWTTLDLTELPPKLEGHTLRYWDPGDILGMLSSAVGPPTAVCVLEDTVVGATSWTQVPLARQYHAVTHRAAAFVAGAMNYLRITGPDAVHVLDFLTPKDMTKLRVGRGTFVIFTTPAGTIDNEAVVLRVAEDEYLLSCGGPKKDPSWLPEALTVHPMAKVEEAGVGSFNLKGPRRLEAMASLLHPEDAPRIAELRTFGATEARTPEGLSVWVLRTTVGVEMWGEGEALHQSWVRILDNPDLITPVGWGLLNIFRLECEEMVFGVYPVDFHGGTTLWEAGFGWMAETDKGRDFIGRSGLQRSKDSPRQWLGGLAAQDRATDVPILGEEVFTPGGEFAGYVTTGTYSPKHRRSLAFAHLKPWARPGDPLVINDEMWTVSALPFSDLGSVGEAA